jgi:hypothetical protein
MYQNSEGEELDEACCLFQAPPVGLDVVSPERQAEATEQPYADSLPSHATEPA